MGLIKGFEYDVFISYAHADDLREIENPGWVGGLATRLESALNTTLKKEVERTGREVRIFCDYDLPKDQPLTETVRSAVNQSATFIGIMSKHYLESQWCKNEIEWFAEIVEARSGSLFSIVADTRLWPLSVVQVGPCDRSKFPSKLLANVVPYEFYAKKRRGQDPRYAYPSIEVTKTDEGFYREFNKIQTAFSTKLRLALERVDPTPSPIESGIDHGRLGLKPQSSNYVAILAADDQSKKVSKVTKLLEQSGLEGKVVTTLNTNGASFAVLSQTVKEADGFVLLLGNYPGSDENISLMKLAYDEARRLERKCLVWISPRLKENELDDDIEDDFVNYKTFLEGIFGSVGQRNISVHKCSNFPEFLSKIENSDLGHVPETGPCVADVEIFVDAERVDSALALKVLKIVKELKLNVTSYYAREEVGEAEISNRLNFVEECDGVVLVAGNSGEQVVHHKVRQLRKISSRRKLKKKPELSVAIVDASPPPEIAVVAPRLEIIKCQQDNFDETLTPGILNFLNNITAVRTKSNSLEQSSDQKQSNE